LLKDKAPEVFENLDELTKGKLVEALDKVVGTVQVGYSETRISSGPIPPAEELQAIEKILPGGVDRILRMAEKNQDSRIENVGRITSSQLKQSERGQVFALVVLVVFVAAGMWCMILGQTYLASIAFIIGALEGASLFITGRVSQARDLAQKRKLIMGGGQMPKPTDER
jgi:uncharacterized membrane protein